MKHPLKTLHYALAFSALVSVAAYGEDIKPDAEGYVRNWLMLAPIPIGEDTSGSEAISKDQVEKESALKPKAGDKVKVKDKELVWKAIKSKEAVVDINNELNTREENVAGYLVAYINCEKELTDLNMLIGCNDEARIYLNGKEIFLHSEPGTLQQDEHKVEKLTLTKGTNVIVFKIINDTNDWQGCIRFKDKADKPVTEFTVKLEP
jgi:hypothetical protein